MECMEALEVISAAMDREPVDAGKLAAAKEHCRECAECSAFVGALVAVSRAPLPEPSAQLTDRIVDVVRAEHARAERAAVALETAGRARAATGEAEGAVRSLHTMTSGGSLRDRLLDPRNRRPLIAWSSVAAVALVAAGIGAVYGTRAILTDSRKQQMIVLESGAPAADDAAEGTFGNAQAPETLSDESAASTADTRLSLDGTGLIVVDGAVYQSAGPDSSVKKESLTPRGTTRTSLAAGETPADREVLGTDDPSRVFIEGDDDVMLAFDRVTTSYEGRTYVLQSGTLGDYGSAAVLPDSIAEPLADDGTPTFEPAEEGPNPTVYVLRGADAASGIAMPPGARPDVAQGWSWWLPAAQ